MCVSLSRQFQMKDQSTSRKSYIILQHKIAAQIENLTQVQDPMATGNGNGRMCACRLRHTHTMYLRRGNGTNE